jgi:HK97 family phage major capsid protein
MSKEARALLKRINDKKNEIRSLQAQGKTKDMQDKFAELKDLQAQFDILLEMEDDEEDGIRDSIRHGRTKNIDGADREGKKYSKKQVAKAFVNRIVCGLRRKELPEEDQKILDMMTEADPDESGESDGGFTVPQDINTDIQELRRTENDLELYVNREPVNTLSGSRVIEIDADSTPWEDVDEGEEFPEESTPKFKQIKYKVGKKGGILKTTRELLQDTAENILAYLNKWIAKKSRATRNAAILKKLNEITGGKEIAVASFDDFKDVFNVTLDASIAPTSIVLTNQDGFNYLDKLKDRDGNYIMQPDVTDKTKMLLFGRYPIHVVSNKTLKSENVLKGGTGEDKDTVTGYKYPVFMGDLKEAITLFDREKITVELSTEAGDLWAKDLTGIKVRDRFDVQAVDEAAVVKGIITVAVAG